mgnify:CR=1 FL=1
MAPSFNLIQWNRQTYDILHWIGDIGGLSSGVMSICLFMALLYSELNAAAFLLHKLFLASNDEFQKQRIATKPQITNFVRFFRSKDSSDSEDYSYLKKLMPLFSGTYKWCVTGTPFDKGDCFNSVFDFVTQYKVSNDKRIIENENIYNYLVKSFFRRNTKQSVKSEYQLIPYDEKILYLKFSPTERAIYNAYLADPNVRKFSKLVRQLCCDPRIADEIKATLSTCTTLEDIEKKMVQHYKKAADTAQFKVDLIKYRIKKLERRITVTEYRRQRKFLKQIGYRVIIDFPPKIYDQIYEREAEENNIVDEDGDDEQQDEAPNAQLKIDDLPF